MPRVQSIFSIDSYARGALRCATRPHIYPNLTLTRCDAMLYSIGNRSSKRRLFVAHVSLGDAGGPPTGSFDVTYAVLALSPAEAMRAIRKERGWHCTVRFKEDHGLPEAETIERLGLQDGRARSVA